MAHVGKSFPLLLKNQVAFPVGSSGWLRPPSRKIRMNVTALGQVGSAAVQWSSVNQNSNVGDYASDDSRITTYTFTNPSNSALTIECRYLFEQIAHPTPGFAIDQWRLKCIHRNGSFVIAEDNSIWSFNQPWSTPTLVVQIGPNWQHKYDLAQQTSLRVFLGASNWAQQPDYHPYRH